MQTVDIPSLFSEAAFEANGKHIPGLGRASIIAQLGLDSVAIMEVVSVFEERLNIRFPDDALAKVETIGDLGVAVQRLLPRGTVVTYGSAPP